MTILTLVATASKATSTHIPYQSNVYQAIDELPHQLNGVLTWVMMDAITTAYYLDRVGQLPVG